MKAKEATEIVNHPEKYCDNPMLHQIFDNAKGYLEGHADGRKETLEGEEVKALVEAVEKLSKDWKIIFPNNSVIRSGSEYLMEKVDQALDRYREAIKPFVWIVQKKEN